MTYEEFLAQARELEPTAMNLGDDSFVYKNAFEVAKDSSLILQQYLRPPLVNRYIFAYTMHLICITPAENNDMYKKYLPDGFDALGVLCNSASDSTSSSNMITFKGLQNLDFAGAELASTPFGRQVLGILQSYFDCLVIGG